MSFFKSQFFHNLIAYAINVGAVYVAVRYPAFSPLVGAVAGAAGFTVTTSAFNQDPNAKAVASAAATVVAPPKP